MKFRGKISLNPAAFTGVTKSEFKKRYADKLGNDLDKAWEFIKANRPRK
jgi:hypothetical protein